MDAHLVFESVTDMDKNLETLSRVKANCTYRKYFNLCKNSCHTCKTYHNLEACYEQLAKCDQLRVDENARQFAMYKIVDYKMYKNFELKNKVLVAFCVSVLLFMVLGGLALALR